MRSRPDSGLTSAEWLIALAVLALGAGIVVSVWGRFRHARTSEANVAQMRRVYVGWTMYMEDHGGPSGSLAELGSYVDRVDLVSPFDPGSKGSGPFPIEPTLPDSEGKLDYRISYAYVGNYLRAGKAPFRTWQELPKDTAIFTDPWHSPWLQVRYDGSLKQAEPNPETDFRSLFAAR